MRILQDKLDGRSSYHIESLPLVIVGQINPHSPDCTCRLTSVCSVCSQESTSGTPRFLTHADTNYTRILAYESHTPKTAATERYSLVHYPENEVIDVVNLCRAPSIPPLGYFNRKWN